MATDTSRSSRHGTKTRHCKEDALTDRQFELLVEGCDRLSGGFAQQARFLVLVAGRLGLRAGELVHIHEDWVDWRKRLIEIPRFRACEKGRGGGICGYCEQGAKQLADYNDGISIEAARREMWRPKTDAAARKIPFDFDARVELAIERFFDNYGQWPASRTTLSRRLESAAQAAEEIDPGDLYCHALRATAATHHAGRGLDVLPLQSLMGWAQSSTAEVYVKRSVENTRRELHMVHSR